MVFRITSICLQSFPSSEDLSGLSWSLNLISVSPSTEAGSCIHTALGEIFSHANFSNILRKQHTLGHENFHWISQSVCWPRTSPGSLIWQVLWVSTCTVGYFRPIVNFPRGFYTSQTIWLLKVNQQKYQMRQFNESPCNSLLAKIVHSLFPNSLL